MNTKWALRNIQSMTFSVIAILVSLFNKNGPKMTYFTYLRGDITKGNAFENDDI